jgi:hypothetical protein
VTFLRTSRWENSSSLNILIKIMIYIKWWKYMSGVGCTSWNIYCLFAVWKKSIQAKSKKLAKLIFLIFNTLNFYGMLKLLFICTDDTFYLGEN